MNNGFWDLDPEERGAAYYRAEQETGRSFWDLSPEERGRYYDRSGGTADAFETTREIAEGGN